MKSKLPFELLYPRANAPWTQSEDWKLVEMFEEGRTLREIGASVRRHQDEVRNRLDVLLSHRRLNSAASSSSPS